MPFLTPKKSQIITVFIIAATDSCRYVLTQALWMRLAGLDDVAAIFGRWQVFMYTPVFGFVFVVPHRVIYEQSVDEENRINYDKFRKAQVLFLGMGVVISILFAAGSSPFLKALSVDKASQVAQMAMGFSVGGVLHTMNFAHQNAFYAIHNPKIPIVANVLALIITMIANTLTFYLANPKVQPLLFGLSLAAGEWIKILVYERAHYLVNHQKRNRFFHDGLFKEWREYSPGIAIFITFILESGTEFLTLLRVSMVVGVSAVNVLNLAMPLNFLFLLFIIEAVQSYQVDIKRAFLEKDTAKMRHIFWRLSLASIIMPGVFILGTALSSPFNYYGFNKSDCLVGLGSIALLNVFNSHSFTMKQLMLCDKIVSLPTLISTALLLVAFGLSFADGLNNFPGIMFTRTVAYVMQDLIFTVGCWDWVKRGDDSLFKRSENTLGRVKSSRICCFSFWGESNDTDELPPASDEMPLLEIDSSSVNGHENMPVMA